MARRLDARAADFEAQFSALISTKRETEEDVAAAVRAIISDVRLRGDAALIELSQRFDRVTLDAETLRLTADEIGAARAQTTLEQRAALDIAAQRIETYHRRQLPKDDSFTDETGATLGWRWTALDSVGLYVPGGTASYPSSVLMNAVPAKVAGVARIVMVTPASGGAINPLVLEAARRAGITEIYRIGGAQAVAALAFGTQTIAPVDKIVGPGNAYVAAAKREVFGKVGIDSVAGPSEILVVADGQNNPDWIAADLLSQAEHDTSSQSILITDDAEFATEVEQSVARALETLPRKEIAGASWSGNGAIIVVADLKDAASLANRIAPEHLEIATENPGDLLKLVRHAGAIFLGRNTPEAMGDYIAGPNHVLPTARTARFSSGLSVLDFMKRTTLLSCESKTINAIGPAAITLAEAEGLDAHAVYRRAAERQTMSENYRIATIDLDERTVVRRTREIEQEREIAIYDLLEANLFHPLESAGGPYKLILSVEDNRLVFDIRLEDGREDGRVQLPLSSFRRVIKDYFLICESYFKAIRNAPPSQIETLDMSRRSVHNEGSELLREQLKDKIEIDFDTARRLFTLCVLHLKG